MYIYIYIIYFIYTPLSVDLLEALSAAWRQPVNEDLRCTVGKFNSGESVMAATVGRCNMR